MNTACTYFDRNYLAQGVVLWRSLAAHDPEAELFVLALDDETLGALRELGDPRLHPLALAELLAADAGLAAVQVERSRVEFIFSLTPCLLRHVFRMRPTVQRLMYLDADLYFFGAPGPIWSELGDGSVLIVSHRFPQWHDDSSRYGRFNVGVLVFCRDAMGQACLGWWREKCLESTALAADQGRYGDQKYLDEWPARFSGVVESTHAGVNVAPWNWAGHRFTFADGTVRVDGVPLLLFHFAQFKPMQAMWADSGQLEYGIMPRRLRSRLYGEYWLALHDAESSIRRVQPRFSMPRRDWSGVLRPWHLGVLRLFWGQCWRWNGRQWCALGLGVGRWSGRFMAWYRRRRRPKR